MEQGLSLAVPRLPASKRSLLSTSDRSVTLNLISLGWEGHWLLEFSGFWMDLPLSVMIVLVYTFGETMKAYNGTKDIQPRSVQIKAVVKARKFGRGAKSRDANFREEIVISPTEAASVLAWHDKSRIWRMQ